MKALQFLHGWFVFLENNYLFSSLGLAFSLILPKVLSILDFSTTTPS